MKKIYSYLATLLLVSLFTTGCSDSFLDENPKAGVYADNIFTDLDGFKLAKNALLHFPRQERREPIQSAELGIVWKIGTDVAWANTELSWTRGLNTYTNADLNPSMQFLNGDTSGNPGIFLIMYQAINSANLVIGRAESPDIDWMGGTAEENEKNKNEIIAHARLIRAWAYRHLIMTFGDVPISTEEITGANYRDDWEREPISKVQQLIEEDLLFAEKWLPDNSNDVTRLSGAIAQHYLAELYLWQDRNEEAEEKAKDVIERNGNYKLITERYGVKANQPGCAFMDQFYNGNILPDEGNTEALWVFPNSEVKDQQGQYSNCMRRTWIPEYYREGIEYSPEYGGRGLGRAAITAWVFSIYEEEDDRFSEYAIRKEYKDARGRAIKCGMEKKDMVTNNNTYASTRKWDWTYDDPNQYDTYYSFADQTYLRIADTYLLLAEALHKQNKNGDAAYYINKIRTRSNASPIQASDVTIDFILDERARELVTEEPRRETLMRTGKLVERTRKYNHIASGERNGVAGMQAYHVLLPIPQKIIDSNVNKPMGQNDGY